MTSNAVTIQADEQERLQAIEMNHHARAVGKVVVEGIYKMVEAGPPANKGWIPLLDSYKRNSDRSTLTFMRPDGSETVELPVDDAGLQRALDELRAMAEKVAKGGQFADDANIPGRDALRDTSGWLTMIGSAIGATGASEILRKDKDHQFSDAFRTALTIHSYLNITATGLTIGNFSRMVCSEIVEGLEQGTWAVRIGNAMTKISPILKGAGYIAGAAKLGFDFYELATLKGSARAQAVSNIYFDWTGLGLTIGGDLIGGTIGGMMGVLAVPLFGVGLGTGALVAQLVDNYSQRDATGQWFKDMQDNYVHSGYRLSADETTMVPYSSVAIQKLDLAKGTVTFGPNLMNDHRHYSDPFDMHEAFGVPHEMKLEVQRNAIVLPYWPSTRVYIDYNTFGGSDEGVLKHINGHKRDDGRPIEFESSYGFLSMTSYQKARLEFSNTYIEVVLGKEPVSLAMPEVQGERHYEMWYTLRGAGGSYVIKPSSYGAICLGGEASTYLIDGGATPTMSFSDNVVTVNGTKFYGIDQNQINLMQGDGQVLSLDKTTKQWNVVHLSAEWVEANKGNFPLALSHLKGQRPISIEMWRTKPGACDSLVKGIAIRILHQPNMEILKNGKETRALIEELKSRLPEFKGQDLTWAVNWLNGLMQVLSIGPKGVDWRNVPEFSAMASKVEQALNDCKPSSVIVGNQFKIEDQIVNSATFDPATEDITFATANGHLYQQAASGQYKFIGIDMRHPSVDVADAGHIFTGVGPVKEHPSVEGANEPIGTRLYSLAKAEGVNQFSVTTDEISGVYISRGEKEPGSFFSVTSAGELFETAIQADTQKIVPEHFRGVSNEFISKCNPAKLFETLEAEAAKHKLGEMIVQWKGPKGKMVQGYYKRDEKAVYLDDNDGAFLDDGAKLRFDHDLKTGVVVGLNTPWFDKRVLFPSKWLVERSMTLREMVSYVQQHGNNGNFTIDGRLRTGGASVHGEYDATSGKLIGTDTMGNRWELTQAGTYRTGITAEYFKDHAKDDARALNNLLREYPGNGTFTFEGLPMGPGAGEGKTIDGIYDAKTDRAIAMGNGGDVEGLIYVNPAVSKGGEFAFAGVSNEWAQHLQKPLGRSLYDLAVAKGVDHFTVAIGDITGVYTSHGETDPGLFQSANANGEVYEMVIHDATSQIAPQFVGVNADFISKCQRDKVPLGQALYDLAVAKGVDHFNVSTAEVTGLYTSFGPNRPGTFHGATPDGRRISTYVERNTSILDTNTGWPGQQVQLLSSPVPGRSELAMLSQAMSAFHRTEAAGSAGAMAPRNDEMLPTMASFAAHRPG